MRTLWTIVGTLAAAAAVYLVIGAQQPAPAAPVAVEQRTVVVRERAILPSTPTQQNRIPAAAKDVGRSAAPAPEELEPPTADQSAAAQAAMAVVDTAISAGRWTDDDNARLGTAIRQLHALDRDDVMQVWATAVNEQRLKIEAPPVF